MSNLFTFQSCSSITPRRILQKNYLCLHQVWTQFEQCTVASKLIPWPHLSEITGLLADSGQMILYDLRSRDGLSALLCFASTGLISRSLCRSLVTIQVFFMAEYYTTLYLESKCLSCQNNICLWHGTSNIWHMYVTLFFFAKGHPPSADLRYGEDGSINPRALVLAAIKG